LDTQPRADRRGAIGFALGNFGGAIGA